MSEARAALEAGIERAGQLKPDEPKIALEAVNKIFKALSKPKQMELLGEFNEACLFLERAVRESKIAQRK